jgi:hypothetical protein
LTFVSCHFQRHRKKYSPKKHAQSRQSKFSQSNYFNFQTISHSKIQQHNKLCLDQQQQTTQQLNKRRKSDVIDNRLLNSDDSDYRVKSGLTPVDLARLKEEDDDEETELNGHSLNSNNNNNVKTRRNLNCDEYQEDPEDEQEGEETNNNTSEMEQHIGLYEGFMKQHQNSNFKDSLVPNMTSKRNINDILKLLTSKMKVSSLKDAKVGGQKPGDVDIKR